MSARASKTELKTLGEAVAEAGERLTAAGVDGARREASLLLANVMSKDAVFLIAHPEHLLTRAEHDAYNAVVRRRELREPFHYIIGKKEFFGLEFLVSPDVLIPRPETELLVETAIEILRKLDEPRFLEVGAGSGCISISILHRLTDAQGAAVDISEKALRIAARNAERHGVNNRLEFRHGDLFAGITEKFALVVSNPPYIPDADIESLQIEVAKFEPRAALFAGVDGLDLIRRMIAEAPDRLSPGGALSMEIGFGQAEQVTRLFDQNIWSGVEIRPDLNGIARIVTAVTNGAQPRTT